MKTAATYIDTAGRIWEPSAWARGMLATVARRVENGWLRPCPHKGTLRRFWASWEPSRLLCAACCHAAELALRGTAEQWTCDRCGDHRPGDCAPFTVPTRTATHGLVVLRFGLCSTCKAGELG